MNNNNEQPASLRFGHIAQYDEKLHAARVTFPESGIVSAWLPILTHNSLRNHDEFPLDPGEHVACLMRGNGSESGVILGAIFDKPNPPKTQNSDIRSHVFSDGTSFTYDRGKSKLDISCSGDISISATGSIKISGKRIDLN